MLFELREGTGCPSVVLGEVDCKGTDIRLVRPDEYLPGLFNCEWELDARFVPDPTGLVVERLAELDPEPSLGSGDIIDDEMVVAAPGDFDGLGL